MDDDRNTQVGWTSAQWNRVREEVLREWQRVRVAGSFLPVYGPLPPSTQVVPSEVLKDDGTIDDAETSRIYELTTGVILTRQQVAEEDLSGALLLFRRAATALAMDEDDVIFNGQTQTSPSRLKRNDGRVRRFPHIDRIGGEPQAALNSLQAPNSTSNPGPLGLVGGALNDNDVVLASSSGLQFVSAITRAVTRLEANGYGPPFVCVLGSTAFVATHEPIEQSLVLPADRIEPLVGAPLIRASVLDYAGGIAGPKTLGLVMSLAGNSMDVVIAVEARPEFTHVDANGHYVFRVFERLALRVKDNAAIVRLAVEPSSSSQRASASVEPTDRSEASGNQGYTAASD